MRVTGVLQPPFLLLDKLRSETPPLSRGKHCKHLTRPDAVFSRGQVLGGSLCAAGVGDSGRSLYAGALRFSFPLALLRAPLLQSNGN
jgi:hypothetical protein